MGTAFAGCAAISVETLDRLLGFGAANPIGNMLRRLNFVVCEARSRDARHDLTP
jgi:hypothetical protein